MAKIAFKSDNQSQNILLPPSYDELISQTHPVRVVNSVLDHINITPLLSSYKGGVNSCFHPRTMLKILVYAYLNNIYSGRQIEKQLQENIPFIWLAGGAKPTIKRERNKVDKIERENIFHPNNLYYNSAGDYYICPMGQKMQRCGTAKSVSDLGYVTHLARYRSMRPIEPEAVFGQIKSGHLFRRFALRSLEKVNVEFGLIAIAHNLKKWVVAMFTSVDRTAAKTLKKMELYLNFTLGGEPEIENLKIAA